VIGHPTSRLLFHPHQVPSVKSKNLLLERITLCLSSPHLLFRRQAPLFRIVFQVYR
jgi:hypothetical protein